jgi:hypothetical protein
MKSKTRAIAAEIIASDKKAKKCLSPCLLGQDWRRQRMALLGSLTQMGDKGQGSTSSRQIKKLKSKITALKRKIPKRQGDWR